ncbi:hypothetical protein SNE40_011876 [Patella caerulea]|uniref:Carbohydrate sulfotransferase n=1 Tax=Patella caerulea TaxID=87958 RepID=A0AAN8JMS9_PATCE
MGFKFYYKYLSVCLIGLSVILLITKRTGYVHSTNEAVLESEVDIHNHTFFRNSAYKQFPSHRGNISSTTTFEESEQQRRLNRIGDVCKRMSRGNTENILIHKPKKMSYCVVPKNGCTYWIRVMRYLNNDTESKVIHSPFEMTRSETHGFRYNQTMYRLQNKKHREIIFNTTRFMVSRNPYSRLLSGYMDKLFLPLYWGFQGTKIIKTVRSNPSDGSLKCGHDLSFQEFLDYLITAKANPTRIDGHFRPIQFYCSPCLFKPHILAKQETFKKDSEYILQKFDLAYLVKNYDHKSHVNDELRSLLDEYIGWSNSKIVKECLGREQYLLRIWKTFQINGYLPLGSEIVLKNRVVSGKEFKKLVISSLHHGDDSKEKMKKQRHEMMVKMYRNVSKQTLDGIIDMFQFDFELFGYEKRPSDIFT